MLICVRLDVLYVQLDLYKLPLDVHVHVHVDFYVQPDVYIHCIQLDLHLFLIYSTTCILYMLIYILMYR